MIRLIKKLPVNEPTYNSKPNSLQNNKCLETQMIRMSEEIFCLFETNKVRQIMKYVESDMALLQYSISEPNSDSYSSSLGFVKVSFPRVESLLPFSAWFYNIKISS